MFTSPGPIAFTLFGMDIRWYGILIACGILLGSLICYLRLPKYGMNQEHLLDVLLFSIPMGIIGARAYYVLFNWSDYQGDLFKIINIRGGGLAIHGGLILGLLTACIVCRVHKMSFLALADLAVPSIALAQSIGRWGNFFNSEAHGYATDVPWAVMINGQGYHPTFLYESIWCFLLCIFLIAFTRRRKFNGQILCLYVILYSMERFVVEGFRTDSLMLGFLRQAQVLSITLIVVFVLIYIILKKHPERNRRSRS